MLVDASCGSSAKRPTPWEEARQVAAKLAHGEAELTEISKRDYEELGAARQLAGEVPLLAALEEWTRARQICDGQLIPAAEAWAARQGTSIEIIPRRGGAVPGR